MKTEPAAATPGAVRAPTALPLAVIAFLTAPPGWIVVGFRAGEGTGIPAIAWIAAAVGTVALVAAFAVIGRARGPARLPLDGPARAARGLAVASIVLAAVGPVFWGLVQLAPREDSLDGALVGPAGFLVAILVGMISFFSPCILPLLPGYLSFVSGLSGEEIEGNIDRRRVVIGTGLFTLGFATVFTALGATASLIGSFFIDHIVGINRIAGGIVIIMGIAFLVPQAMRFMEVERRPLMRRVKPGLGGAFPLGLAFAVGWTPCVGPGLGVMLGLGAASGTVARGALLLFFFSVGFGIWFVLAALGIRRALGASAWLRRHTRGLQAVGGVFLVALGVLLVTNYWDQLINPLRRLINQFAPPV